MEESVTLQNQPGEELSALMTQEELELEHGRQVDIEALVVLDIGVLVLLDNVPQAYTLEPDRQVGDGYGRLMQGCIEELEEHVLSDISGLAYEQGKGLLILLEEDGRV